MVGDRDLGTSYTSYEVLDNKSMTTKVFPGMKNDIKLHGCAQTKITKPSNFFKFKLSIGVQTPKKKKKSREPRRPLLSVMRGKWALFVSHLGEMSHSPAPYISNQTSIWGIEKTWPTLSMCCARHCVQANTSFQF